MTLALCTKLVRDSKNFDKILTFLSSMFLIVPNLYRKGKAFDLEKNRADSSKSEAPQMIKGIFLLSVSRITKVRTLLAQLPHVLTNRPRYLDVCSASLMICRRNLVAFPITRSTASSSHIPLTFLLAASVTKPLSKKMASGLRLSFLTT